MKSALHLDTYTRRDVLKTLGTFLALPIVNERIWSASYDVAGMFGMWQRDKLYWHFPYYHPPYKGGESRKFGTSPQSAIRKGNYKLLYRYETSRIELFNLSRDISEKHNISQELPELMMDLKGELMDFLKTTDAQLPKKRT